VAISEQQSAISNQQLAWLFFINGHATLPREKVCVNLQVLLADT
jgi:hypothetical protein